MSESRIIIYGNAGSWKTTMARAVAQEFSVPRLCLDQIAWAASGVRMPIEESIALLDAFMTEHSGWVIEGCYGDLVEAAVPRCTELRFLNPGVEVCIAHARQRPWEPEYCSSPEEQARLLEPLIDFVRQYETRQDEYGLARHREIFEAFTGPKREYAVPKEPRTK